MFHWKRTFYKWVCECFLSNSFNIKMHSTDFSTSPNPTLIGKRFLVFCLFVCFEYSRHESDAICMQCILMKYERLAIGWEALWWEVNTAIRTISQGLFITNRINLFLLWHECVSILKNVQTSFFRSHIHLQSANYWCEGTNLQKKDSPDTEVEDNGTRLLGEFMF